MKQGTQIFKLDSQGHRLREKILYLDQDMDSLSYKPSRKKKQNRAEISSITHIQSGENVRERFRHRVTRESITSSVSITFTNREPLNFIVESPQVAKYWCEGLQALVDNKINLENSKNRRETWLREMFQRFATKDSENLSFLNWSSYSVPWDCPLTRAT